MLHDVTQCYTDLEVVGKMTEPIGFKPPEPPETPQRWPFHSDAYGMDVIVEIIEDGRHSYVWVPNAGGASLPIASGQRRRTREEVEAIVRAKYKLAA